MEALKKSILLQVSVPVLSDRIVFTMPSSCERRIVFGMLHCLPGDATGYTCHA